MPQQQQQPPAGARTPSWRGLPFFLVMASSVTHGFLLPPPTTPATPPFSPSSPLHAPGLIASPLLPSPLPCAPHLSVLSPLRTSTLEAPPSPSPPPTRRPPQRAFEAWTWRGHRINYRVEGDEKAPPILLIHGFGASVSHFRNQFNDLPPLGYRVFAVDLLGFGGSDKVKEGVEYELELWRDLLVDFMEEMERSGSASSSLGWTVGGNSIGGLLTLMVADAQGKEKVKGCVLFNAAGGLTSFREEELPWVLRPLWVFVRVVLFGDMFGPGLFQRFRTEENVRSVLSQVYGNKTAVDDELVDILLIPGQDDGAEEVFLKVLRAPAGPSPEQLLPRIEVPIIGIWGEDDPWTPMKTGLHPGIKFAQYQPVFRLFPLPKTGHCPHDERPAECLAIMKPFLEEIYGSGGGLK